MDDLGVCSVLPTAESWKVPRPVTPSGCLTASRDRLSGLLDESRRSDVIASDRIVQPVSVRVFKYIAWGTDLNIGRRAALVEY